MLSIFVIAHDISCFNQFFDSPFHSLLRIPDLNALHFFIRSSATNFNVSLSFILAISLFDKAFGVLSISS
jgi:hypothetical protein